MQKPIRIDRREVENYFISMTDMMIGILFVFIIMLMAFALNLKSTEQETNKEIERLKGNYETRKEILLQLKDFMAREGINVIIEIENGILRLPEEILFDSGSSEVKPRGQDALSKLHGAFLQILPCYTKASDFSTGLCDNQRSNYIDTIFIEGHTDDIPINTQRYRNNWELSAARSISTFKTLLSFQPQLDSLRNQAEKPIFSVSGYADTRNAEMEEPLPVVQKRQRDRRIDIRFIMATPTLDEIKEIETMVQEKF